MLKKTEELNPKRYLPGRFGWYFHPEVKNCFSFNTSVVSILNNQFEELELLPHSYAVDYSLLFATVSNKSIFICDLRFVKFQDV